MSNSKLQRIRWLVTFIFVVAILASAQRAHSNYLVFDKEENLFERFKEYLGYLKTNDLFSLDLMMSSDIPYSVKQLNIEWQVPEKNRTYVLKPYTFSKVEFEKSLWTQVKNIYGFEVETVNDKHKVLELKSQGLGEHKDQKVIIRIRFYRESGEWRINEIEHTLKPHNEKHVLYSIDF